MSKQLSYPSAVFPAPPVITLDVPEDWEPLALQGVVLAAGAPLVQGVFRPNVVVATSRFTEGYELQTAITAVSQKFASLEQSHEIGRELSTINGTEWFHIETSFIDSRAGTLVQAVHLAIIAQGPFVDLVQVTATVTGTQAHETMLDVVRGIQRSVVIAAN
jgi:hypothetical protein